MIPRKVYCLPSHTRRFRSKRIRCIYSNTLGNEVCSDEAGATRAIYCNAAVLVASC